MHPFFTIDRFLGVFTRPNDMIRNLNCESTSIHDKRDSQLDCVEGYTLNHHHSREYNIFTCSPYHHFITYCEAELTADHNGIPRVLQVVLMFVLSFAGFLLRLIKLDRVVVVNNTMFSTNLGRGYSDSDLKSIINCFTKKFPDHTLLIRSINDSLTAKLLSRLQKISFKLIPCRSLFVSDPNEKNALKKRPLVQDFAILEKLADIPERYLPLRKWNSSTNRVTTPKEYKILDTNEAIIERALSYGPVDECNPVIQDMSKCYDQLYLKKYSECNIQFTPKFFADMITSGLLRFVALEHIESGRIDGAIGFYCLNYTEYDGDTSIEENRQMCVPLLGYNITRENIPLYRLLSCIIPLEGILHGSLLNQSSGAASFKKMRGCKQSIEYFACYDQHLPLYRRIGWSVLDFLSNYIGAPVVKMYGL